MNRTEVKIHNWGKMLNDLPEQCCNDVNKCQQFSSFQIASLCDSSLMFHNTYVLSNGK